MGESKQNLTTGSLWKKILIFSIPLMISNVLQVLFNMADVAVVGRFAGAMALGSVGSTTTLVTMFTGFLIGMSGGINVLTAHYLGAGDKKGTTQMVHTAAIISLIVAAILMFVGIGFSRVILQVLKTKPELIDGAVLYMRIYLCGMPAMAIYNFGNAVFSASGDTKRPLFYLTLAGVINVILNLFFVIVCGLSVAGVALATIVSQYISATLILIALFKSKENIRMRLCDLKIDKSKAKDIVAIGIPAGFQNAIFQIANLFIQSGVNSFDAVMVAGNSAAANADALVYDVMAAFYTACGSFMGQNYGAGKKDRMMKSYWICLAYSFAVGAVMGGLLVAFGRAFLAVFTTEQAVIDAGMKRLVIMGFSYCVSAFMDNTIAASRAMGKGLVPTIIVIMGSCVFRVIWVYTIFAYFKTIPSLYLLYVFSWSITAIAEMIYFFKVYSKDVR